MKEQKFCRREIFNSDGLLIVKSNFVLYFSYDLFELEHKTGFLGFSVLRDTMKFLNLSRFLTVNEELR